MDWTFHAGQSHTVVGLVYGVYRQFLQQYSSYIVAVSFIGGGNRTW